MWSNVLKKTVDATRIQTQRYISAYLYIIPKIVIHTQLHRNVLLPNYSRVSHPLLCMTTSYECTTRLTAFSVDLHEHCRTEPVQGQIISTAQETHFTGFLFSQLLPNACEELGAGMYIHW